VTILLLVDDDPRRAGLQDAFLLCHPAAITIAPIHGDSDVATRTCAAINAVDPPALLVIAATGSAALTLPAVARSQSAQHRRAQEYVLLDPDLPAVTDAWPDARVTVVCDVDSEASIQARLRGWDLLEHKEIHQWAPPS
jgi:hypothetical protein